jgi:phosphoglycolate phosphatase
MIKNFIFDFDGTLVNSENAIYQSFSEITRKLAPERIEKIKNILIGPPLKETVKEILGNANIHLLDQFVNNFIKLHDESVEIYSQPYPNVEKVLKIFYERKYKMAIATNKRQAPTLKLINHFGFMVIECSDSSNKTKKNMTSSIIKNFGLKDTFFIGDTINDAKSALSNNIKFIRARYGYGKNENWNNIDTIFEIDDFNDLLKIFD